METILFQFLKYPFYWKQVFHLVKIFFKQILYYCQWQRIFCLNKCRPIFKEEHYSCSLKPFSWILTDIAASGSSFFLLVEMKFLSLIASSVFKFWVNFKPYRLIQTFFSATGKQGKPVFFDFFSS